MNKLDFVTSQYKPGAVTELENELILNWYPQRILKHMDAVAKGSLLEFGIGHGHTTVLFNKFIKRHVVVEGSAVVIDLFRSRYPQVDVEIVHAFFETFSIPETFNTVIMGFILEHVDDPALILDRARGLIKKGGHIYIAVPNAKSLNRRLGLAMGKIGNIYDLNENDLALGHKRQFCRDTIKALLVEKGYAVTWEEGIYLKPLPLGYMQKMPEFRANLVAMCEVGVDFPDLCVGLLLEAQIAL